MSSSSAPSVLSILNLVLLVLPISGQVKQLILIVDVALTTDCHRGRVGVRPSLPSCTPLTSAHRHERAFLSDTAYRLAVTRPHGGGTRRKRGDEPGCVLLNDSLFGDWAQLSGDVEVVSLPEAMEQLVEY